jgi:hypothetical protein
MKPIRADAVLHRVCMLPSTVTDTGLPARAVGKRAAVQCMFGGAVQMRHCTDVALCSVLFGCVVLYVCCPALSLTQACLQGVIMQQYSTREVTGCKRGTVQMWRYAVGTWHLYAAQHFADTS